MKNGEIADVVGRVIGVSLVHWHLNDLRAFFEMRSCQRSTIESIP